MIEFGGHGILLDVEGTTSSIRFVYDEMFPFARRELDAYLRAHWGSPTLNEVRDLIARDAHEAPVRERQVEADEAGRERLREQVVRLMDADAKTTGLKQLQGLIWRSGFESGELKSHLYEDVPPALTAWNEMGLDVRIYSSGSVAAQKLFFGHTVRGDLLHLLRGHYDTTTGPKTEAASYERIASDFGLAPEAILFLSDVVPELDAARAAGLRTGLCVRPGNAEPPENHGHDAIASFDEIRLSGG